MKTPLLLIPALFLTAAAVAQSDDIARGNMHFDAKAMDANGDGMISKDEMQRYGEDMWVKMARTQSLTLPVADAARDFARGNLRFDAKRMDADNDGQITQAEFMKYGESQFHEHADAKGMVSVADAAKYFGRGNMPPPVTKAKTSDDAPPK